MEQEIQLKDNHVLKIIQDEIRESPRDWDNLGIMICSHSRYHLGDIQTGDHLAMLQEIADSLDMNIILQDLDMYEEIYNDEEKLKYWITQKDEWVCLPLYLYDHSGITMSTASFSCSWDSGQVGYIYCPPSRILKEYGNLNEDTLKIVAEVLEAEVKVYDQYLTGDVYGFRLVKVTTCNQGHEHEEEIDSCWGFYGDDWKENGMKEHIDDALIPEEELAEA
jgi:hypothetical protein